LEESAENRSWGGAQDTAVTASDTKLTSCLENAYLSFVQSRKSALELDAGSTTTLFDEIDTSESYGLDPLRPSDSPSEQPHGFRTLQEAASDLAPNLLRYFPIELIVHTLEAMLYCYYGRCTHVECSSLRIHPTSWEQDLEHVQIAAQHTPQFVAWLSRMLTKLPCITPLDLGNGVELALRLRRKLEDTTDARASHSRRFGTHFLVLTTGLLISHKCITDEDGPKLAKWASAGAFPMDVLRAAEMDMLGMLDWSLL
jgi:hypothetical protein